ncbi:histidinol-phosphate transaminase [Alicyclobacillus fastidiosus]|uniref:Histidinol-phosphate aminotransferase n=1 Tax=Alicyclobacillus fastidiosus TaxID=392011 RepID=A0ABY6ZP41_9BACL|nr:histidinol-phosphate transaminase [Alicyclobacillus fastidiosus]WAH44212.1 histidinol-phosphate transaminase [Alicyclobacillus fastidiosus]GMA60529.1 histidinol-phosphate aminotransferase [Alicyclobacillus fastidiosus]
MIVLEVFTIFNTHERVRSNLHNIHPYQPGISEDQLRKEFGLAHLIKLNSNENALGPSPLALEAIARELPKLHLYPDGGSDLLREAIARHHALRMEEVFAGNGSDDIIKLISETFLEEGDEVVVPFPSFSQYGFGAEVMKANIRSVPLRSDFSYDVQALLAAITNKTKLLYLCTPNNPTGTVLKYSEFTWLMERVPKDVFVIVDLAYDNYATDPERFFVTKDALIYPNVCYLHTFSKLYGLAGLRVGYALGNEQVWSYVHRVREPFNVNRVAQRGAQAALEDVEHVRRSVALAQRSREQYATLENYGLRVIPSEANFTLVEVGNGIQAFEQLKQKGILVRAGYPGLESFVRVTFGLDEENEVCIEALCEFGRA